MHWIHKLFGLCHCDCGERVNALYHKLEAQDRSIDALDRPLKRIAPCAADKSNSLILHP